MFKNEASQKVAVFAWDNAAGVAKTGDAANITAQISKDGGACAATNDAVPTELDAVDAPGIYLFDTLQAETNADLIVVIPVSATGDIVLRPVIIYTQTVMRGTDGANTIVPDVAGTAPTTIEIQAEMEENGASILDTLQDRITALLPTKTEMDTAHGLLATEAKQDIIDTNVDQIETTLSTLVSDIWAAVTRELTGFGTLVSNIDTQLTISHGAGEWGSADVQFLKDIGGGRWLIDEISNQMIFYKADNITEVARFNLFDENGVLAHESVYERRRVITTTTTTTV